MNRIAVILIALFIVNAGYAQDNEKRIKFSSGTLNLCTQANLKIKGYDGDEVIIKSLNKNARFVYNLDDLEELEELDDLESLTYQLESDVLILDSIAGSSNIRYMSFSGKEKSLEKGLKPLGKESKDPADNLYLDITENPGELIIRDYQSESGFDFMEAWAFDKKYEITIPNSVKLLWNTDDCSKKNSNTFFVTSGSQPSEISDFKGEVEVSLSYGSVSFTDVVGPVIANTIGGNIQVEFKKTTPSKLYSLITENGYINMELPEDAGLSIDATASRILSDIDFKVLKEETEPFSKHKKMSLKSNSGSVKMKLDAGSGSIYLRKN
ncbi:hypothetical protein O3Q51_09980 [Cryomorphaceae bacterium 1068]|nr:hypothetical protein [Cryomorphaceae bacterium 1068]